MAADHFIQPADHIEARVDKPFKHTFFQSPRLLVGLNTLAPGQRQSLHEHGDQDKFYLVISGRGQFTVADATQECGAGELILAPAGVAHGVENPYSELLSFVTVIAPFHD